MRKIKKYVISAAAAGILIAGGQNVKAAELNADELLPKELQTDQAEPVLENTAPAAQPAAPDETFPSPQETAPEFTQMPEEMTQAPDPGEITPRIPAPAAEGTAAVFSPEGNEEEAFELPAASPEGNSADIIADTAAPVSPDSIQSVEALPEEALDSQIPLLSGEECEGEDEESPEEPVHSDSVTPSGTLTVSDSTADQTGTNWIYTADNEGETETGNSLTMVNAGLENLTVQKDLTIIAAGVNKITSILLSGMTNVKLGGSGIFLVDSLQCDRSFVGSFGLTEGGSAAFFLKNEAGVYELLNPQNTPGILDEAYVLDEGRYVIPKDMSLELPEGMTLTISLPYEPDGSAGALTVILTGPDKKIDELAASFDQSSGRVLFQTKRLGDFVIVGE